MRAFEKEALPSQICRPFNRNYQDLCPVKQRFEAPFCLITIDEETLVNYGKREPYLMHRIESSAGE